jgi:hypothetical protein
MPKPEELVFGTQIFLGYGFKSVQKASYSPFRMAKTVGIGYDSGVVEDSSLISS